MESHFIGHITAYESLTEEEIDSVLEKLETITLNKDEYLLKEGEICRSVALLSSGLVMYYKISESGEEQVLDFALQDNWVSQYQSMISQTPSPLSIRAIEKTSLCYITMNNLQQLYREVPVFERIARQIIEKVFVYSLNRTDSFQNLRAEDRYEKFLQEHPELAQRVPQYHIASFLGIAPQSLSRIRKNIRKN